MKKEEFLKKADEYFELIPEYFFNTFQKKIDESGIYQNINSALNIFADEFKPINKTNQFEDFVLIEWIVDYFEKYKNVKTSKKVLRKAFGMTNFKRSTQYFRNIGQLTGIYIGFEEQSQAKAFFDMKRTNLKVSLGKWEN